MMLLIFLELWFLAVSVRQDEISMMEFYEYTLLGCGFLFYTLGEVCAKMRYLSEIYGGYIKLIGVILAMIVGVMIFVGTPIIGWIKDRKHRKKCNNEY